MPPPDRDTLPTIGSMRRMGIRAAIVTCESPICRHSSKVTFDTMGMSDATVFIEIPRSKRFRCTKCGARKIEVFPDWSEVRAEGAGKPRG